MAKRKTTAKASSTDKGAEAEVIEEQLSESSETASTETETSKTPSDRVKLVYNATIRSSSGVVLDYLLRNDHFNSRQGREKAIDAIALFYRAQAEEAKEGMDPVEVKEVAQHCVNGLMKQVDFLCEHFGVDMPPSSRTPNASLNAGQLGQLEQVLKEGFGAIASAIKTGGISTGLGQEDLDIAASEPMDSFDIEQGVTMSGDELGELGELYEPSTFDGTAA